MKKNNFLRLVLFLFIIASTLIIANLGVWIKYPQHFPKPHLIFVAYKQLLPDKLPALVKNTTIFSIVYFMVLVKLLILKPKTYLKYGYAKFAKLKDLKEMGFNFEKGILLGKFKGKFIRTSKPYSTLVLAPPGTGKTSGVIIPTLLMCNHSMIIHDPKGELYDTTAKIRQDKLKQKVLLFDLADKKNTCHFNPFAKSMLPKNKDNIKAYITTVANIIFNPSDKNVKDQYFLDAACSSFIFFTEWLVWKNKKASIPQIRNKLLEATNIADNIEIMIKENKLPNQIIKDGVGALIASKSENQWAGVMGELREILEPFGEHNIAKLLNGRCDFNADTFRKNNTSLYIKVRDKDRKRLRPIISMVIELLGSQLISKQTTAEDNQVSFILDEFTRLAKMEIIADLPSISRSYKISTIFVAQDYEQISTVYGKDSISIFDSNCAYKVIFKQNNYFTAEKLSKLIGNKTVERVSNSKGKSMKNAISSGNSTNKSESFSQEGIPLVTPQDILNMEDGKCLIITQGFAGKPVMADVVRWWKEKQK